MIRTIIIDDERHAIREINFFLEEYPEIDVVASYTNPMKAIEELNGHDVQLIFLDINMPQISGMDLASKILDIHPEIKIVFITAYDQYALEAFDLNAIDYILKPIQRSRFEKTMERITKAIGVSPAFHDKKLLIKCFGAFKIGWESEAPVKWRTDKTKELFVFLLMHAGFELSKDRIIDTIWSDIEAERATKQLHNGIYYIRKTLEEYGIDRSLVSISGNYCLKLGAVNFDKLAWNALKAGPESEVTWSRVEGFYQGDYLEGVDWHWTDIDRDNFGNDYVKMLVHCANNLVRQGDFAKAEECLCNAYRKNPYDEAISLQLLKLYVGASEEIKAIRHFKKYAALLKEEFKIQPSKEILELYNSIK